METKGNSQKENKCGLRCTKNIDKMIETARAYTSPKTIINNTPE